MDFVRIEVEFYNMHCFNIMIFLFIRNNEEKEAKWVHELTHCGAFSNLVRKSCAHQDTEHFKQVEEGIGFDFEHIIRYMQADEMHNAYLSIKKIIDKEEHKQDFFRFALNGFIIGACTSYLYCKLINLDLSKYDEKEKITLLTDYHNMIVALTEINETLWELIEEKNFVNKEVNLNYRRT